ncbi:MULTISPECIES: phage antirepressor KilAC domain-containing protein [Calothrix]|uniref:Phage antirepressor KilAC domain-containing protein n=2 Tax=Calothrix TaxID=1186 RepID=A0ABR8AAY8_9CYAN|nr:MULTISPECIES: phage antirepressor KilAC domain-containing protein [Calothrix]MBD2196600.1 phage antirepressor KilAC domain-containing protein [Calothrix parietina FACHB-288]MBD2228035.1 phage antirepressor KilAC domain-containing protein [Calothrix anomala FACHB-343]
MSNLIISTQNGIQYFTINATGESGMSQSGLARACGVSQQAINKLILGLTTKSPSEILEPFTGKNLEDLTLTTNSEYHNVAILKDTVCAAVLTHYAQQGKVEAAISLGAFAAVGIRVYIQQINGWKSPSESNQPKLPQDYLSALKALVAAEEEKQALALKAAEQEQTIKVLEPKAEVYDQVIANNTFHDMAEVAKIINIKNMGRNNLFSFLRNEGILRGNNTPYQNYVNQGYFKVVIKPNRMNVNNTVTLVSPKGIEFIIGLLEYAGYKLPQVA